MVVYLNITKHVRSVREKLEEKLGKHAREAFLGATLTSEVEEVGNGLGIG